MHSGRDDCRKDNSPAFGRQYSYPIPGGSWRLPGSFPRFRAVPPASTVRLPRRVGDVRVTNNEFRNHQEVPFGFGLRVAAIGPGAPNVVGTARVAARDNDLSDNRFAVVAEAGFTVANTPLLSHIELSMQGNTLGGSCQTGLLIALTNQGTAAGLASGPSLRNSTYSILLGGDIAWSDVWYSHPAGAGNTLTVDGLTIDNGARVPYDRLKACPVP